jgi:hypothetical protein
LGITINRVDTPSSVLVDDHLKRYSLFGMSVASAFPLPIPTVTSPLTKQPDLHFDWGHAGEEDIESAGQPTSELRCYCPAHNGTVVMRVYRQGGHVWIVHELAGVINIHPDGTRVEVAERLRGQIDMHGLGIVLSSLVAAFVLHHRGIPCLHTSSVVTPSGTAAFLGQKRQGKSTMAAAFLRQGAKLLTDDMLPLIQHGDTIQGLPSLPLMKLWNNSVEHTLEIADDLPPIAPNSNKKLLVLDDRYVFADEPQPIHAFYVLDRFDVAERGHNDVVIRSQTVREGLVTLIEQSSLRSHLSPQEIAALIPFYIQLLNQSPVRIISFPTGFEYQHAVYQAILDDLANP